jgi:hypothetical protein
MLHRIRSRRLLRSGAVLVASLALVVTAGGVALSANNGIGTMVVSPTSAVSGASGLSFTFTYTDTGGNFLNNGVKSQAALVLTIPANWTAPSGHVTVVDVSTGHCRGAHLTQSRMGAPARARGPSPFHRPVIAATQ